MQEIHSLQADRPARSLRAAALCRSAQRGEQRAATRGRRRENVLVRVIEARGGRNSSGVARSGAAMCRSAHHLSLRPGAADRALAADGSICGSPDLRRSRPRRGVDRIAAAFSTSTPALTER